MMSNAHPGSVRFFHYANTGNIGDLLCSPRHYFDFESDRDALIVGGGASNNFFCGRARRQNASVRIAWGIGQSWAFGVKSSALDRMLKSATRRLTYARASTRDPFLASDRLPLVPCVSVFSSASETPVGDEVGIFVNSTEQVSGIPTAPRSGYGSRAFVASNALPPDEFMRLFRRTGTIITNSYHASYWGLLSGRRVHIIGYSSKFTNLAVLFGLPESSVLKVARGDAEALDRAIRECADREPLRLAKPEAVRSRFREQNLDFARSLRAVGISASLKGSPAEAAAHDPMRDHRGYAAAEAVA